jgi:hypothetical protein
MVERVNDKMAAGTRYKTAQMGSSTRINYHLRNSIERLFTASAVQYDHGQKNGKFKTRYCRMAAAENRKFCNVTDDRFNMTDFVKIQYYSFLMLFSDVIFELKSYTIWRWGNSLVTAVADINNKAQAAYNIRGPRIMKRRKY